MTFKGWQNYRLFDDMGTTLLGLRLGCGLDRSLLGERETPGGSCRRDKAMLLYRSDAKLRMPIERNGAKARKEIQNGIQKTVNFAHHWRINQRPSMWGPKFAGLAESAPCSFSGWNGNGFISDCVLRQKMRNKLSMSMFTPPHQAQ